MKKFSALVLICILLISLVLSGCSKQHNIDYIINSSDSICIGVLTSNSESSDFVAGINYAAQLAHTVNLDKPYEIKLQVINAVTEEEISDAVFLNFASENVAAVICEGNNKEYTDSTIKIFSEYNNTPLLFVDNYSDTIADTENVFSISVPYSYQASAVVSHLIGEGMTTGAVVCSSDNEYQKDFAKVFTNTFTSSGGSSATTYYYSGEEQNFNANTISAAGYEFVFVIGNTDDSKQIHSELTNAGVTSSIIFSETTDKTAVEASDYSGLTFISKFEADDNNYIGTDFINTYAKSNNISTFDVTAKIAYGYDAYMTIYDSLVSLNSNHNSIFQTTEAAEPQEGTNNDIYVSDVLSAIKGITHMGVTDVISFNKEGLTTPTFIYTDRIENAHAGMLNRYNYSNEQN
ncbi:MAG: ABC transporter substrate-binding protein [Ruminococcus sp.]|nr:ABC transporter substrate-binding protein [Ruminococcus sp.]